MGLPAGVTTATVTSGGSVTFTGVALSRIVSIVPSVPITHVATGIPLVNMIESQVVPAGSAASFALPHVDQNGFQDSSGASYKNWYYIATIQDQSPTATLAPVTKNFQVLVGQTTVDLDLLPTGTPAVPWSAAVVPVVTVVGQNGNVSGTQILADTTVAAALTAKQNVSSLDTDVTAKATTGGTALNTALNATYAPASGSANYASPAQAAGLSAALSIVFGG
jgi:hypothetical protein